MNIIKHLYSEVYSLEGWIRHIDVNREVLNTLKTDSDSEGYKGFLDSTVVALSQNAKRLALPVSFCQVSHQREVIVRVIERIRKHEGIGKNVLTLGFGPMSDNPYAQISNIPNLEYRYPNSAVNRLHYGMWKKLLSRIGDTVMEYLLEHTVMFTFIPPSCYVQITGKPSFDLWPFQQGFSLSTLPTRNRTDNKKRDLSHIIRKQCCVKSRKKQRKSSTQKFTKLKKKEKEKSGTVDLKISDNSETLQIDEYIIGKSLKHNEVPVDNIEIERNCLNYDLGGTNYETNHLGMETSDCTAERSHKIHVVMETSDCTEERSHEKADLKFCLGKSGNFKLMQKCDHKPFRNKDENAGTNKLSETAPCVSRKRKNETDVDTLPECKKAKVENLGDCTSLDTIHNMYCISIQSKGSRCIQCIQMERFSQSTTVAAASMNTNIAIVNCENEGIKLQKEAGVLKRKGRKRKRQKKAKSKIIDFKPFNFHTYFPRTSMLYSKYLCEKLPNSFLQNSTLPDSATEELYKVIIDSNDTCCKEIRFIMKLGDETADTSSYYKDHVDLLTNASTLDAVEPVLCTEVVRNTANTDIEQTIKEPVIDSLLGKEQKGGVGGQNEYLNEQGHPSFFDAENSKDAILIIQKSSSNTSSDHFVTGSDLCHPGLTGSKIVQHCPAGVDNFKPRVNDLEHCRSSVHVSVHSQPNISLDHSQPSMTDTGHIQPSMTDTGHIQQNMTDTGHIQPSMTDTGHIQPSMTDTGHIQPSMTDTGHIQPSMTDAGYIQPSMTGTGHIQPSMSGAGHSQSCVDNSGQVTKIIDSDHSQRSVNGSDKLFSSSENREESSEDSTTCTARTSHMEVLNYLDSQSDYVSSQRNMKLNPGDCLLSCVNLSSSGRIYDVRQDDHLPDVTAPSGGNLSSSSGCKTESSESSYSILSSVPQGSTQISSLTKSVAENMSVSMETADKPLLSSQYLFDGKNASGITFNSDSSDSSHLPAMGVPSLSSIRSNSQEYFSPIGDSNISKLEETILLSQGHFDQGQGQIFSSTPLTAGLVQSKMVEKVSAEKIENTRPEKSIINQEKPEDVGRNVEHEKQELYNGNNLDDDFPRSQKWISLGSSQQSDILNQSSIDIEYIPEFNEILKQLMARHRKCRYRSILCRYCQQKRPSIYNHASKKNDSKKDDRNKQLMKSNTATISNVPVFKRKNVEGTSGNIKHSIGSLNLLTRRKMKKKSSVSIRSMLSNYVTHTQVYLFLRLVCMTVIPNELWGSSHNRNIFFKNIRLMVSMGKYDKFCLGQLMGGVKTKGIAWLSHVESNCMKMHILAKLWYWLMKSFIMVILKSFFYITETTQHRNRLCYYRKSVWTAIHRKGLSDLLQKQMLEVVPEVAAKQKLTTGISLGVASLRFLPKKKSLRPIINLGQQPTMNSKQTLPINRQLVNLHHVLSSIKNDCPYLVGSGKFGTDEIYSAWKTFSLKWKSLDQPPLYFVKTDISNCYDTINQDKLFNIIQDIFTQYESEEFVVRKFASIVVAGGRLKRTFHRKVQKMIEYTPDFMSYLKQLSVQDNLRNIILIDQVVNQHENMEDLLQQLKSHVQCNIIKIGKQYYVQKEGISQGSILSTLLCNLYYGHMESQMLSVNDDEVLLRLVDDFLFVTPNKSRAVAFLNKMAAGDSEYSFSTNIEKMLVNFEYVHETFGKIPSVQSEAWFPWCGMLFNTSTLNVSNDFSRYSGIYIEDTMSFDLASKPGQSMKIKLIFSLRPKCHSIFLDTELNSEDVVITNCYKLLLMTAYKFHVYAAKLPCKQRTEDNPGFFLDMIMDLASFFFSQAKFSRSKKIKEEVSFCIDKTIIQWLTLHAFVIKLIKHQSQYKTLIRLLKQLKKSFCKKLETKETGLRDSLSRLCGSDIPHDFSAICN